MVRHRITSAVGLVFALIFAALPQLTVSARNISFVQDGNRWTVTVTMCTNGFKVDATGATVPTAVTEIRVEQANEILPNDKPPFIQLTQPVQFTSGSGSNLVASATDPQIPIKGTGSFYFQNQQAPGKTIQTTIAGYINGSPFAIANGIGTDKVKDCRIPLPTPQTNDLTGVYVPKAGERPFGQDGRATPWPGDKVAIYCVNTGDRAGVIVVFGFDNQANPFRLGEFKLNDVTGARPRGISKPTDDGRGVITMQSIRAGFVLEWTIGSAVPVQIKIFQCNFNKALYNKTPSQRKYPDAFGNDGRIDPKQGDKMAIYCPTSGQNAGSVVVMGINSMSQGYVLAILKYSDLVKASPNPITVDTHQTGTVIVRVDNDDNFYVEWRNGPWSDYEAKGFRCRF